MLFRIDFTSFRFNHKFQYFSCVDNMKNDEFKFKKKKNVNIKQQVLKQILEYDV